MPQWAQIISKFLPLTYGIKAMRASLLGTAAYDVMLDLTILGFLGVVYIGIGALMLKLIERNLKKKALLSVF